MSNREAYGYAVARIRAMELRLLDAAVFARLLDADDTASILKILGETSYASVLTSVSGETAFDKILETALQETYSELSSFVPDKELLKIMRLPYDFSNAKVMLKSYFNVRNGGKKRWDLLTSLGSYPVDKLIASIDSEEYALLPFGLNTLYPKCISVWEQSKDVLETERLMDRQMFSVMLSEAQSLDMPEIFGWVRSRIDGENIRTLLRLKRFGYDAAKAWPFMNDGGNIDPNVLVPLISEPFETWSRILEFSNFSGMLSSIDAGTGFADVIMDLERDLDDFYLDSISQSKYSPNNPGNVLAYLWDKELEIKNIRMIVVSKSSTKDKDQARRLLRHVYV